MIEVQPATRERWEDVVTIFGGHGTNHLQKGSGSV